MNEGGIEKICYEDRAVAIYQLQQATRTLGSVVCKYIDLVLSR
jgi:hypothetical protein